jgi:hypothetical protein
MTDQPPAPAPGVALFGVARFGLRSPFFTLPARAASPSSPPATPAVRAPARRDGS